MPCVLSCGLSLSHLVLSLSLRCDQTFKACKNILKYHRKLSWQGDLPDVTPISQQTDNGGHGWTMSKIMYVEINDQIGNCVWTCFL